MNTKLISLVVVIILIVSGAFVFKNYELNKKSSDLMTESESKENSNTDTQSETKTPSQPTSSKTTTPVVENKNEIAPTSASKEYYIGGIVITSFKPNDLVKLPLNVEGYSTGNGWSANEGELGNVEVFDANGKSISNVAVLRSITDWMKYPVYFKASVGDREMMSYIKTDTGTVRFSTSEQKDGKSVKTVSVPVRFK